MNEVNQEEKKELVLSGTVKLDADSMEALRAQVREEVVQNIEDNGIYADEAERYLRKCSYQRYLELIVDTIGVAVKKAEKEDSSWRDDERKKNRLQAIQSLLRL